MIWYYITLSGGVYRIADIHRIAISEQVWFSVIRNGSYPFRLESKYRYSGVLYDKLRCLLSYVHYNYYSHIIESDEPYSQFLAVIETRFDTRTMNLQYNIKHLYYGYILNELATNKLATAHFVHY